MNNNLNQKHIKYIPGFYLSGKYMYIYTEFKFKPCPSFRESQGGLGSRVNF